MKYKELNLTFGQKFTLLRQYAQRTETETADLLKKPVETYVKYENDNLYPTESLLRRVAKLYGLSYNELMVVGESG